MSLFGSIGRVLVKYAGNAACFGFGGDALVELWDLLNKSTPDEHQKLTEIEKVASCSDVETRQEAQRVAMDVAGDQPQIQETVRNFLTQIPASVRCSLKRPVDPSGRTVPTGVRMKNKEDLLKFLPAKLARFRHGTVRARRLGA